MTGFRFDVSGTPFDLRVAEVSVENIESGGDTNSVNGSYLWSRTGPVRRQYSVTLPLSDSSQWVNLLQRYQTAKGPWEMYDPTVPNLLSIEDRQGIGWVQAGGTAITSNANMRMAISSSPASVQTAISSSPTAANLCPVNVSTQYTAAITVEAPSSFTGTLGVYGYTATPSGSGTLQGSTTALTTAGRYTTTFTTGGTIVYVELRIVRTAGSATLCDPSLIYGPGDIGKSLRTVAITSLSEQPKRLLDNWSTLTATIREM